jgi:hypothetical protein
MFDTLKYGQGEAVPGDRCLPPAGAAGTVREPSARQSFPGDACVPVSLWPVVISWRVRECCHRPRELFADHSSA